MNLSHTASWRKSNYFGMASESFDKGVKTMTSGVVPVWLGAVNFAVVEDIFREFLENFKYVYLALPIFLLHFQRTYLRAESQPICNFHLARSAEAFRKVCQQTQIESQVEGTFSRSRLFVKDPNGCFWKPYSFD